VISVTNGIIDRVQSIEISEELKANLVGKLILINCKMREKDIRMICDAIKLNSSLAEIQIHGIGLGSKALYCISEAVQRNSNLKVLNLSKNGIGINGAKMIAKSLKGNTSLKELNLFENFIETQGALELSDVLKENNSVLKNLNLRSNRIGQEGFVAIGNCLKTNKSLEIIDLSMNFSRSESIRCLADALKVNSNLKRLYLCKVGGIGIQGMKAVIESLRMNYSIALLDLSNNNFKEHIDSPYLESFQGTSYENRVRI
jgi:Ran GTPase-activating protein (RanGAP) involved in mRNA processing and transport